MKKTLSLTTTLIFCTVVVLAQIKKPQIKTVTNGVMVKPLKVSAKISLGLGSYQYKLDNGHVDISYARSKGTKDDVKTTSKPPKSDMCLSREEVRGQKIENELTIADGSMAMSILPGGVIDADVLLKSGQFKYIKMDQRKPVSISTASIQAKKHEARAVPGRNNSIENDLRSKVYELISPSNMNGMPNIKSNSEASISTLLETTGIKIGASFFYMGISADNNFSFSSEKYRYMYLYQFDQECLTVIANSVSSPADLFKDDTPMNSDWLYINEVKYGRRLYVLMESEYDLMKFSDELNGNLEWGVVSAALTQTVKGSSLSDKTNIRVLTQGGKPIGGTDPTRLQAEINSYFDAPFKEIDILPLSYKLTYMDGEPVSMISNAFLDGDNCLDKSKMKIRISKVECVITDDNKDNEELYGSASIYYYNSSGKTVALDGKTVLFSPPGLDLPIATFTYGTKEIPIILGAKKNNQKSYEPTMQGKYIDVGIATLDMKIKIKPSLHEKDSGFNADDDFLTEDKMEKTVRQMLLEGSTSPVFEFRRKKSVVKIYFEITPI